jgi:hypothetical protein
MKTLFLLGFTLATTPTLASAASLSPTDAASLALKACIEHVRGMGRIEGGNAKNLETLGFKYQRQPPEFLTSTKTTPLGEGEYARAPSNDGEVWSIGYDSGGCMIVTLGTSAGPVEKGYLAVFDTPGTWRKSSAPDGAPGERTLRYLYDPERTMKLTALVSLRDADGITSITLTRRIK